MIILGCFSLGIGDPQFSSPSVYQFSSPDQASDRIDEDDITSIDPALLQAVLADPVLLQAVDPHVLQAVLVQAATANLQLELDSSSAQKKKLPSFPATPSPVNISIHPAQHNTVPHQEHHQEPQHHPHDHHEQLDIVLPQSTDQFQTRFGPEEIAQLNHHPHPPPQHPTQPPHPPPAPPAPAPTAPPAPAPTAPPLYLSDCSVITHLGEECDPGLAYNSLTRTCEWPDTLLESGCNPEGEIFLCKK